MATILVHVHCGVAERDTLRPSDQSYLRIVNGQRGTKNTKRHAVTIRVSLSGKRDDRMMDVSIKRRWIIRGTQRETGFISCTVFGFASWKAIKKYERVNDCIGSFRLGVVRKLAKMRIKCEGCARKGLRFWNSNVIQIRDRNRRNREFWKNIGKMCQSSFV